MVELSQQRLQELLSYNQKTGDFSNPVDAHAAYVNAAERFFGEFARVA